MKYVISLLVLIVAVVTAFVLYGTGPETKKAIPKRPVPLVETVEVSPVREKVFVEVYGTVIPAKRITLQSEVEGRIVDQNPELIPGGLINQGDIVLQIDPSDYEFRVSEYRAEMEEAVFELDREQGRQVIAKREWTLLEKEINTSEAGKSLALREPHLRLVKAKVDKAKSRLDAAELALERTTIRAPFNSLILEEFVDNGQLVGKQTSLATLVGTDQYWVQVSIPVALLQRISFPGGSGKRGSAAQIIFEPVNGVPIVRKGHIVRLMGDLDPDGRMARLLIAIDDPLNIGVRIRGDDMQSKTAKKTGEGGRILLGSYVKVVIDGGFFDDVYSIPREALREGDVLWIKDRDDTLQIRKVNIVWRRKDEVLVNADLASGDMLILSRLQSPLPGMSVRSINK